MRWWLELPLSSIVELWNSVWGVLGPAITAALILYIRHPEKFEKMIVHVARFLSLFSGEFEKKAVAREVPYIVSSEFAESYRIEERVQEFRGGSMIIRCPFRTLHLKL